MIRKKLLKKAACLMAVATVTVTGFGTVAYGYGEYRAGSTVSQTDGSNDSNPKSGDSSMVAVAIGGTLLVAGLAGLVIYMGRKESNLEK